MRNLATIVFLLFSYLIDAYPVPLLHLMELYAITLFKMLLMQCVGLSNQFDVHIERMICSFVRLMQMQCECI